MTLHTVDLIVYESGGLEPEYMAWCSCNYRSKWFGHPGLAARAGESHIKGKGGNGNVTDKRISVKSRPLRRRR